MSMLAIEADWRISDGAIVVFCRSEKEARSRAEQEYEIWANLAYMWRQPKAFLRFPRCRPPGIEITAKKTKELKGVMEYESIIPMPALVGEIPIAPVTRRALDTILDNPSEKWFLHRITPEFDRMTQIAVSEAAASLIVGATPLQAVGRSRLEYMPRSEFDRMAQTFRRDLSEDRPIEFAFDLFSPVTRGNWRRVDYRYQIVGSLPNGDLLQLGQCLSCVPIPDRVRR